MTDPIQKKNTIIVKPIWQYVQRAKNLKYCHWHVINNTLHRTFKYIMNMGFFNILTTYKGSKKKTIYTAL